MQLGSQTKKLMRKHKLEAAVSHFREVAGGVDWEVARQMARQICQACDCNLERAVQAFFSGETPCSCCCSCKACPEWRTLHKMRDGCRRCVLTTSVDAHGCAAGHLFADTQAAASAAARPVRAWHSGFVMPCPVAEGLSLWEGWCTLSPGHTCQKQASDASCERAVQNLAV